MAYKNYQQALEYGRRFYREQKRVDPERYKRYAKISWKKRKNNPNAWCNRQEKKDYQLKHQRRNRAKWRGYQLKYKYGVTREQYDAMLKAQSNACAICGRDQSTMSKSMSVDHCHISKKVRGLVCQRCNVFIGYIETRPDILPKVRMYLEIPR